jgi:hypothetical protein
VTHVDVTADEYCESTQKMLELTLSIALDRGRVGGAAAMVRSVVADELYALGVGGHWTARESRFLEWMADWDPSTIAAFLTVVRRAALS